jgi:NAD+ diphosphatase
VSPPGFRGAYAFARPGLDRAAILRDDPAACAEHAARPGSGTLLLRADGRVLLDAARRLVLEPPLAEGEAALARLTFLGLLDGQARFARVLDDAAATAAAAASGGRFADLRGAVADLDAVDAGVAAYARALAHWQSRKRWCGVCGAATRLAQAGHRAECTNPDCAATYFPRTDPAIIVIVSCGDRCLLGRQPSWPAGRYSTLAGFVEPGETLEQTVAREVHEETGVVVDGCRYLASQPWPFPASLMLGFEAQATLQTPQVGSELADARWFAAAELPGLIERGELALPPAMSISYHLIAHWYRTHGEGELPPGQPLASR